MTRQWPSSLFVLLGSAILTFALGSVHAFSVFLAPLEQAFSESRAAVSLTYSIALVSLTFMVLVGHRIYNLAPAWGITLFATLLAAGGSAICILVPSLVSFWIGYGILFGAANGIGYGFAIQISAQAFPKRSGLAIGIVTASYALGASLFPKIFSTALADGGLSSGMLALLVAVILAGATSSVLIWFAGARFQTSGPEGSPGKAVPGLHLQRVLWFGYGAGAAAGLMIIGHAAGIVRSLGFSESQAILGTSLIGLGNMFGGICAGPLSDRIAAKRLLIVLPLTTAVCLWLTPTLSGFPIIVLCLATIGFCYGALIVVYPAAIVQYFGIADAPQIYGRVFTAWGLAGLAAPWFAGALYTWLGDYRPTIILAGFVGLASSAVIAWKAPLQAPADDTGD